MRGEQLLGTRSGDPAPKVAVPETGSQSSNASSRRRSSAITVSKAPRTGSTPADHAGAAAEGHYGDGLRRAVGEHGGHLVVIGREDYGVRCVLRGRIASSQQVGCALAAGVPQPVDRFAGDVVGADESRQTSPPIRGQDRRPERHIALITTRRRLPGDPEHLRQQATDLLGQRFVPGGDTPGVPHHIRSPRARPRVHHTFALLTGHALQFDMYCQAVIRIGDEVESVSTGTAAPDPAGAPVEQTILDAARDCVAEFGVRRTTLTEVARRAGVSRPTVYRRWSDSRALVAELLVRELREIIAEAVPTGGLARDRLVTGVVTGAAEVRSNPLFGKIFRTDTDLMLTYVFGRLGRNQRQLLDLFTTEIRAGQADGSVRAGEPGRLAAMVLLITQSAVQSAATVTHLLDGPALDTELRHALDTYLAP